MIKKLMHSTAIPILKKHKINIFFISLAVVSTMNLIAEVSVSANLFLGRAFSGNIAREMLMTPQVNHHNTEDLNGFFTATGVHQGAWNQSETQGIGAYPFWSDTNSMTVGVNTTNTNLDAYQFGLGNVSTNGSIKLEPIIYQNGSDLMFYIGAKRYQNGFFAKIKSAITSMVVNPGLTEVQATPRVYAIGAITNLIDIPTPTTTPVQSLTMTQALAGQSFLPATSQIKRMKNGLVDGIQSTGAHFSDTEITAGYNFICPYNRSVVSIGGRLSAPTGNKPQGVYVLEPINGRGGNWGIGGYLAANIFVWKGSDNRELFINFMSDAMHLCKTSTIRSYDLISNGHGSKYLLVADYSNNIYQNSIQNLVNISTLGSESSFSVEADIALSLSYISKGFTADLGYNYWGRAKENLTISGKFDEQRYAILGRQGLTNTASPYLATTLCQPTATINNSEDRVNSVSGSIVDGTIATNRISGSDAFNTEIAGQYTAMTSKIFAKIGYTWIESNSCPFLNLMSECELSTISNNALPQWGIILMGGVSL